MKYILCNNLNIIYFLLNIIEHYFFENPHRLFHTPGIKHFTNLFPNTQIMQFQCDDIWRRVDQLNFRFGDELISRSRRRDDQGDELICNRADPRTAICSATITENPSAVSGWDTDSAAPTPASHTKGDLPSLGQRCHSHSGTLSKVGWKFAPSIR